MSLITEPTPVKAYDSLWIIGDDFTTRSCGEHFISSGAAGIKDGYINENFEVKVYMANQYTANNRGVLSRLRNCLVKGIKDNFLLPKYIVFIIDYNILKDIAFDKYGISVLLGRLTEWLANEVHKIVKLAKDSKPKGAKKENKPQILWIEPPLYKNFSDNIRRKKMGTAIANAAKLYSEMVVLQMRKIWDYDAAELYSAPTQRFTADGHKRYWLTIDYLVKLWDTFLSQKKSLKREHNSVPGSKTAVNTGNNSTQTKKNNPKWFHAEAATTNFNDKFHWKKPNKTWYNNKGERKMVFKKLPAPPPKKMKKF